MCGWLIFISHMKSQGRNSHGNQLMTAQPSFHFSLRSTKPGVTTKFDSFVDFTPKTDHSNSKADACNDGETGSCSGSLLPEFLGGKEWCIKGFYQPGEEPFFAIEGKQAFQRLKEMKANLSMDQAIMRPRPASNYCHLCKEKFSDYLKHVQHLVHKAKMSDEKTNKSDAQFLSILNSDSCQPVSRRPLHKPACQPVPSPSKFRLVDEQNTRTPIRIPSRNDQQLPFQIPHRKRSSSNLLLIS